MSKEVMQQALDALIGSKEKSATIDAAMDALCADLALPDAQPVLFVKPGDFDEAVRAAKHWGAWRLDTSNKKGDAYSIGLYATPQPVIAPDGFVLVPLEPTPEVIGAMAVVEASMKINSVATLGMSGACEAYEAMFNAAKQTTK